MVSSFILCIQPSVTLMFATIYKKHLPVKCVADILTQNSKAVKVRFTYQNGPCMWCNFFLGAVLLYEKDIHVCTDGMLGQTISTKIKCTNAVYG